MKQLKQLKQLNKDPNSPRIIDDFHHGDTDFDSSVIFEKITRLSNFIFYNWLTTRLIDSFWLLICLTKEAERFC